MLVSFYRDALYYIRTKDYRRLCSTPAILCVSQLQYGVFGAKQKGESAFENCSQLQGFIHSGKEALAMGPRVYAGSSLEYVVCETEAGISLPWEGFPAA